MWLRAEARDDVGVTAGLIQDFCRELLDDNPSEALQVRAFAGATLIAEALMRLRTDGS